MTNQSKSAKFPNNIDMEILRYYVNIIIIIDCFFSAAILSKIFIVMKMFAKAHQSKMIV